MSDIDATVTGLQGFPVSTDSPGDGQALTWSEGEAKWLPANTGALSNGIDLSSGTEGSTLSYHNNVISWNPGSAVEEGGGAQVSVGVGDGRGLISLPVCYVITSTTSPAASTGFPVAEGQTVILTGTWVARQSGDVTASSSGAFRASAYKLSGTLVYTAAQTIGADWNTGSGGAAASTPIVIGADGGENLVANVVAQSSGETLWVLTLNALTT